MQGSIEAALWACSILICPALLRGCGRFLLVDGLLRGHIDFIRLGCPAFKLADRFTKAAAELGKLFPAEDDEYDHHDDNQFLQPKTKHVLPSPACESSADQSKMTFQPD
jgi:hypothetical protein